MVSWYIALKDPWRRLELPERLTVANDETGEIIEWRGGFDALYRSGQEDSTLLDRIARALGPDAERRWANDEGVDLAAEVAAVVGARDGYRRQVADVLAAGQEQFQRLAPRVIDGDEAD